MSNHLRFKIAAFRSLLPLLAALLFAHPPEAIASHHLLHDDDEVERLHDELAAEGTFPLETRIELRHGNDGATRIKVTFIFSDSGHEVTDWGDIIPQHNELHVEVLAQHTADDSVLPVLTPISHTYAAGTLEPGDYSFEVRSRGHLLGVKQFHIPENRPAPLAATGRVSVHLDADGVTLVAGIRFRESGWTVIDWGEPLRRGTFWSIDAQVERVPDALHPDREEPDSQEFRHRYLLGLIDPPGRHHLQFFVNHHELDRTVFAVPDWNHPHAEIRVDTLTEQRAAHPMRLTLRHPAGIDRDSLGHRNLRIRGSTGYDRFARFISATELDDGGVEAAYAAIPPGRLWAPPDNGEYRVALVPHSIATDDGDFLSAQHLGDFEVKIERDPSHRMPTLHSFDATQAEDGTSHTGTLTVAFPYSQVSVKDWGSLNQEGRRFRVDVKAVQDDEIGNPVIVLKSHSYEMGLLAPGDYSFSLFSYGTYIQTVRFIVEEDALPRARVPGDPITETHDHPHLFRVFYSSHERMDLDSIRETMLRVIGPNDFLHLARIREIERYHHPRDQGEVVLTVYGVRPPEHGWNSSGNGIYSIFAPPYSIRSQAGNHLPGGRIGAFAVRIVDHEPEPDAPLVKIEVHSDDGVYTANVSFNPNGTGWKIEKWGDLRLMTHAFAAPIKIDENADNTATQEHRYRLGRIPDGHYAFVLRASNGFVVRDNFVIGDDPITPFEQWREAAAELLEEEGRSADEIDRLLGLREYAFAIDPRSAESNPVRILQGTDRNGSARLSINYTEVPSATDLSYRIEVSADLQNWIDITDRLFTRETSTSAEGQRRQTVDLPDEDFHRFVRVRAVRHSRAD